MMLAVMLLVCAFVGRDVIVAVEKEQAPEWRFSKGIDLQGSGPYHALFLDEDVYAGADEDLRDLRIVNQKGQYVPYYIDSGYGKAKEQAKTYSSSLVRTALKDGNTILDYKVTPVEDNVDIQGNLLSIGLPEEAFLKHIKVYGSYDGNQWEFIDQSDLYRTDQLVKDRIDLGSAYKYEYYRLSVLNNVEKLAFPSLQLIHNTQQLQWLDYKKIGKPSFEVKQEDGITRIIVNNENRLQITELQLFTERNNYTRSYRLYDDQGVSIDTVGEQDIYQMDFKDVQIMNRTITAVNPIRSPFITIEINNRDDLPLDIAGFGIGYIVDKLVFEDKGEGPYKLLYGNSAATKPQYDIVNFKSHIEQEDVALGKLSIQVKSPVASPTKEDSVWWLQQKIWFNGIIILVSILLIGLLVKKMKPKS
ncbi:hypothetical protein PMSM_18435 [Paenibacillus macquariensis subsp. macquariensis]|nr:hypothetical protein PMSM_18435 [Paenibacillus macquariensis subsp. macquariensis]